MKRDEWNERYKLFFRFVLRYRKKWAAAGALLLLGSTTAAAAALHVVQNPVPASAMEETVAAAEAAWESEPVKKAVLETTAAKEEWKPAPEELNLAHFFPEGADQNDITKSLAGQAFKELMTHDVDWMSGIYDYSDVTPAQMAARLGKSADSVMGRYNPKDSRHDKKDPSTWTVNSFKNIRMTATDGDGNPITPYSNVLEIMSMANLYTYYKGVDDYNLFLDYAKKLWDESHSYTVSISDVYYCPGCMSEDAERKEMEELEEAAKAEALGLVQDGQDGMGIQTGQQGQPSGGISGDGSGDVSGGGSGGGSGLALGATRDSASTPSSGSQSGSGNPSLADTSSDVIIAGKTTAEKASEEARERAEASAAAAETAETVPESTSGVILSGRNLKNTETSAIAGKEASSGTSPEPSAAAAAASIATTDTSDGGDRESTGSGNDSVTDEGIVSRQGVGSPDNASASDAKPASELSASETTATSDETESAPLTDCPGHVDLIIHMKITGLNETNNLFVKDPVGNGGNNGNGDNSDGKDSKNGVWPGWNQETMAFARRLSSQDWFKKYGLTVSSISSGNPLTNSEIDAYMAELPSDLSQTRKEIIHFALSSVGKVPYYWGGKPSAPNYGSNSFGILISPDTKGRVLKGLDCSGWINWVYWSVTGRRLPYESTSGLAATGTRIRRDELQPGDIIVRTGADAHVIMFLGWTADGQIRCIHESSASVNNVTVALRDANWPYYRKLVD